MNTQTRNRVVLVVIALLFLIPLVAAVLLQPEQFGQDPEQTVNRGELVQPTVPLPIDGLALDMTVIEDALRGHWLLVHPLPRTCDATCEAEATDLRQIHIASGRHQGKVAILLVGADQPAAAEAQRLAEIYDQFVLASDPEGTVFTALTAANGGTPPAAGTTFIADPEGNLMMRYTPGFDRGDLNKDLTKLLKWSAR